MISRRDFLQSSSIAGAAFLFNPIKSFGKYFNDFTPYFGLNAFIENHPDSVFILRTNIKTKLDSGDIKKTAIEFGKSIFIPREQNQNAFPISTNIAFKPNLTQRGKWQQRTYTIEGSMGVVTDCNFIEGLINTFTDLGINKNNIYLREANYTYDDLKDGGYISMAERTGVNFKDTSAKIGVISENNINWIDSPNGIWFRKIPYLWPINSPGSVLVNVAKLKTHSMGLTLSAKNLQGTIAANYVRHCTAFGSESNMEMLTGHMNPNANATILGNYERHKTSIPRWDRPGSTGGLWQETWATRCIDNNSVNKPLINIVEGIYGRDGDFLDGPNQGNLAQDYMTNIILFGKNSFHVDIIGKYLAGHEPGNFGLFHLALERGLSKYLNPSDIPLYEWNVSGSAIQTSLGNYTRTPLKTLYLRRDYNGQNESYWHLVNEPFDYSKINKVNDLKNGSPDAFILSQNYPNPFNPKTSIEYYIPKNGNVRLDIININGNIIDILVDQYHQSGSHLVSWENKNAASGVYYYRLFYNGYTKINKMILIK